MKQDTLTHVLNIDAAANLAGGLALLVTAGWLTAPLGLDAAWPLWLLGVLLLVTGVENGLVARRTTRGGLLGLTAVDLLFAVGVLWVAIADPTAAETWTRWAIAGLADVVVIIGIVKLAGTRSLDSARADTPVAAWSSVPPRSSLTKS